MALNMAEQDAMWELCRTLTHARLQATPHADTWRCSSAPAGSHCTAALAETPH